MKVQEVINETVDQLILSLQRRGIEIPEEAAIAARKECHNRLRWRRRKEVEYERDS